MTDQQWADLKAAGVFEYAVGDAVNLAERRAVFRVAAPPEHAAAGSCMVICEAPGQIECELQQNRYLEAMFLQHPNLVRVFDSWCWCSGGQWLHFAVTEPIEQPLSELQDALDSAAWVHDVSAALQYIHENGLVYCALSAASIWRVGGVWKLGDFGELRAKGDYDPRDTRRLLLRNDISAPPEAWEGVVTPAWDAWSLGTLLRIAGSRDNSVAQLVDPSPSERSSVSVFMAPATAAALTPEPVNPPEPQNDPEPPPPPAPISTPGIFGPLFWSAHAGQVRATAARLMRTPGRVVFWVSVVAALVLIILVAAVMWGQREPSPHAHAKNSAGERSDTVWAAASAPWSTLPARSTEQIQGLLVETHSSESRCQRADPVGVRKLDLETHKSFGGHTDMAWIMARCRALILSGLS